MARIRMVHNVYTTARIRIEKDRSNMTVKRECVRETVIESNIDQDGVVRGIVRMMSAIVRCC